MIISDEYKYVYIELPRTGSTAIAKELIELYAGTSILHKHARYDQFLKMASTEQKKYFVFSNIRNPMDEGVSLYLKYFTNHKSKFTEEKPFRNYNVIDRFREMKKFNSIKNKGMSFQEYFRKYKKLPYSNQSLLYHKKFDYIIKYEDLVENFNEVLLKIGISPKRDLPLINPTEGKKKYFYDYYKGIVGDAKWVYGPYMDYWNYSWPNEWGEVSPGLFNRLIFHGVFRLKKFYWKLFR
ncbi:MAG: hypothetical protein COC09_04195 [Gammaproteobacteria bacterium]|nr:sulfotransferase family 2 domain-containing protein [Gammaproteobacteria bacterium]PCH63998.1 MAG: hypothetical protein COC09_04195 [Gammaproteobacteria bacterium]